MREYYLENIRNVVLLGHGGDGKSSLAEAILFNAKAIDRMGSVSGQNCLDYDDEEIKRAMSINLTVSSAPWRDCVINVIDTPGFYDFEGEQNAGLHAAGAAVIVASACGYVKVGSEKAIAELEKRKIPAILFINQLEKENYSFSKTLDAFKESYPSKFAAVSIPIVESGKMTGSVDVINRVAYDNDGVQIPVPDVLQPLLDEYYNGIVELAAESDEELLDSYYSGGSLTLNEIVKGIKLRQMQDGIIFVMGGSSIHNKGITMLMDELILCGRKPAETPPKQGVDENGIRVGRKIDNDLPFSAQVFKSLADPYIGKLLIFKVQTGSVSSGDTVYNSVSGKNEKISQLYVMQGKKQIPVAKLNAGDIGAAPKLNYTKTSDTLCDGSNIIIYDPIVFPQPVISLAVVAADAKEEEKVIQGLYKLAEEDNTFSIHKNAETHETILSGMGETQLEVLMARLKSKYKAEARLAEPKIAYRETIGRAVEKQGKHKKQSGGHGQYGDVHIRFEPMAEEGFVFAEEIVGGSVPKTYIPAVEKGLQEAVQHGVLGGYPMTRIKATLFFGSYHDVDSSEMAFKLAAQSAFKNAMPDAAPTLLEPICKIAVSIPDNYLGDVMSDVNKRRGRILGADRDGDSGQTVIAEVPQAEIARYATDLRSLTQGRGKFTQQFVRYEEVPSQLQSKLLAK